MKERIRNILDDAGYGDMILNKDSLVECFLDYVDSGAFENLDIDQAEQDIKDGDITIKDIIVNMKRVLKK